MSEFVKEMTERMMRAFHESRRQAMSDILGVEHVPLTDEEWAEWNSPENRKARAKEAEKRAAERPQRSED